MVGRSVAGGFEWRVAVVFGLAVAAVACSEGDPSTGMVPIMGPAGVGGPETAGSVAMAGGPAAGASGGLPIGTAGAPVGAAGMSGAGTSAAGGGGGMATGSSGASGSTSGVGGAGGGAGAAAAGSGGGEAGAGGAGGAGGAAGAPPMMREDLGQGDGQDVITIGDSWMNLFIISGIEVSLEAVSGRNYRNYAAAGTLVLNEQIPGQYAAAKRVDPEIKTVIMTGGGNDILSSPCVDDACQPIVDDVSERLTQLMMEMGMDGVEDIVLIGYTYPLNMAKHASLDYSIMLSSMSCRSDMKPRCHFIDSTKLNIMLSDGIHPDVAGYDLLGKTVWELMQKEGMRR